MIEGYAVTGEDWLWLLRAVQAEGAPRDRVARALVNLFARTRAKGGKASLADLVRAYAQPVNPLWANGGAKDADPSEVTAAERRRAAASSALSFDASTATAVLDALSSPWSSDVTDYAAPWVDATGRGYVARSLPVKGQNRLWTRDESWKGYGVTAMNRAEKVAAIRSMAMALPRREREALEAALSRLEVGALGDSLLDGVKVVRPGEPGYDEAVKNAASPDPGDWVDATFDAVSERVKELGGAVVSSGKWLLIVLAALLVLSQRR